MAIGWIDVVYKNNTWVNKEANKTQHCGIRYTVNHRRASVMYIQCWPLQISNAQHLLMTNNKIVFMGFKKEVMRTVLFFVKFM